MHLRTVVSAISKDSSSASAAVPYANIRRAAVTFCSVLNPALNPHTKSKTPQVYIIVVCTLRPGCVFRLTEIRVGPGHRVHDATQHVIRHAVPP
jgi:hypothetical protein